MPQRRDGDRPSRPAGPDWPAIRRAARAGAARRLSVDDRDYPDVVQEAILATFLALDRLEDPEGFAKVAAERRAIDILRRRARRLLDRVSLRRDPAVNPTAMLAADAPSPERTAGAREVLAQVMHLIQTLLTPREQVALARKLARQDDPALARNRTEAAYRRDRADDVHASRARRKLISALEVLGIASRGASSGRRRPRGSPRE